MYMMVRGKVKLTLVHPDGQEVIVQVIGPGDAFGAVAALGGARYPVSAEAGEAVEALEWDGAISAQLFMKYPALAVNALRIVAARMQEVQARLSEQVADRVEQRLAQALLRLIGHAGRAVEGGVLLDLPLTRRDLAALAGTTLYTASRVLSRWRSLGLVAGGRKRVVVRDPHRLAALAAGEQPDGRASATAKPERS